jgi:prepilin-type N-terminal cleavage/methylation domain-containing protein
MKATGMRRDAFSLVELIVVVVILGVLAAMAIPRFSEGATGDAEDDLRADLTVLRTAIELYYQDHGAYPGQRPAGTTAAARTAAAFIRQVTQYTDAEGRASAAPSETFRYGPYLRRGIPRCPLSSPHPSAGIHLIGASAVPAYEKIAGRAGWVYNCDTGYLAANSDGVDASGVRYDSY